MKKNLPKIFLIEYLVAMGLLLIKFGYTMILDLTTPGDWHGLVTGLIGIALLFLLFPTISYLISLFNYFRFYKFKKRKNLTLTIVFDVITLIINIIYMFFIVNPDVWLGIYGIIYDFYYVICFILPNIILLCLCIRDRRYKELK